MATHKGTADKTKPAAKAETEAVAADVTENPGAEAEVADAPLGNPPAVDPAETEKEATAVAAAPACRHVVMRTAWSGKGKQRHQVRRCDSCRQEAPLGEDARMVAVPNG